MARPFAARLVNRRVLAVAAVALLGVLAGWLLSTHKETLITLAEWARANPVRSAPAYLAGFATIIVLGLPTWPLMIAGGYVYGTVFGWATVSAACLAGATVAFLLGRGVARDWVADRVGEHPRFRAVDRSIEKRGFAVVFLLRLSLVIPYNVLNYALGVTAVPLRQYVMASWLGMQPVLLFYVLLGAGASDLAGMLAGGGRPSVNPWLATGAMALAGLILWLIVRTSSRLLDDDLAEAEPHSE